MNKLILIPILILILCGCATCLEKEQRAINECKKKKGTTIINYCRGSSEICSVSCKIGDNNE